MNTIRWQIIIFVVLGFLAGVSGGLLVFNYVLPTVAPVSNESVLRQPVPEVTQGTGIDVERMSREMSQVVVEFYRPKAISSAIVSNVLVAQDLLGQGRVITSDGWILTHTSAFGGYDPRAVLVLHNGVPTTISTVVRDKTTSFVFLKTAVKNVPSIKLGALRNLHIGEPVAIGGGRNDWRFAFIGKSLSEVLVHLKDAIHTSEDLFRVGTLSGSDAKLIFGSPVISKRNEVVGVVAQTSSGVNIMPIEYILGVKDNVFANSQIERPYLGVTYIHLPKNNIGKTDLNQNGALVVADASFGAHGVALKSPALAAGILTGDIITSINDEEINQNVTLSELLLPYKKGDVLEVKLKRKGEQKTVKITLQSVLTSLTSIAKVRQ